MKKSHAIADEAVAYNEFTSTLLATFINNKNQAEKAISLVSDRLQSFGKAGTIKALQEILRNNTKLEDIAKRSYLHGNGFYKIILEDNDIYRLRLHIWLPTSLAEENIHDHRWHFASTILSGTMESEVWEDAVSGGGELLDEYLYIGKTTTEDAHVKYMGKSRVSLSKRLVHNAGDAYYMMSNVMHKILYKGDREIGTLMCHAKDARAWARTITRRQDLPDVEHAYIPALELRKILEIYLSTLRVE